jgi:hypothetical protein
MPHQTSEQQLRRGNTKQQQQQRWKIVRGSKILEGTGHGAGHTELLSSSCSKNTKQQQQRWKNVTGQMFLKLLSSS